MVLLSGPRAWACPAGGVVQLVEGTNAGIYSGEIRLSSLQGPTVVEVLNRETADGLPMLVRRIRITAEDMDDPKIRVAPKEEAFGFIVRIRCDSATTGTSMWYYSEV